MLDNSLAMAFKLGMTVDLYTSFTWQYTDARFDDLDLATRSQWVGRGKYSVLNYLNN